MSHLLWEALVLCIRSWLPPALGTPSDNTLLPSMGFSLVRREAWLPEQHQATREGACGREGARGSGSARIGPSSAPGRVLRGEKGSEGGQGQEV